MGLSVWIDPEAANIGSVGCGNQCLAKPSQRHVINKNSIFSTSYLEQKVSPNQVLFLHDTAELCHQYNGAIFGYFQKLWRKKAKTKFFNCGYTKPSSLSTPFGHLSDYRGKKSSVPTHIPRKRFKQCSQQQEIHTNLGEKQLWIQWPCLKASERQFLQIGGHSKN